MADDIDYSKLSNEELEAIASGKTPGTQSAAATSDMPKPPSLPKLPEPSQLHPALGALGGGYAGYKMGRPVVDWYAAKTASDIGDIATHMKAGQPPVAGGAPSPSMTGGEKWTKSLTGANVPGAQMEKADLDLAKSMQRTVGRGGELAGGTITKGGIMVGPRDVPIVEKMPTWPVAPKVAEKPGIMSRIAQASVPKGALGKLVNVGMPTLSMAGAGAEGVDAWNRLQRGQYGRAAVSGLGALGSAASMIPHPLARIGGTGLAMAAPAVNAALDYMMPEEAPAAAPPMAGSVMQGYADGGNVTNDILMQMIRASRGVHGTNLQSRPGKYLTAENPNLKFVDRFADPYTSGEFQPSTRNMDIIQRPGGVDQYNGPTIAHEYQHFKDELAKQNPMNIRPEDADMMSGLQAKIDAYRNKPINLQTMPVDFAAREGLTGQKKPSEQLSQLTGYEAGLPAGMNLMQSGLGQTLTPQQKAMVMRRMNPLPKGVDAMVGGYATGGLACFK